MIGFNKLLRLLEEAQKRLADMETSLSLMQELTRGLEDRLKALEQGRKNGNRQRPVTGRD